MKIEIDDVAKRMGLGYVPRLSVVDRTSTGSEAEFIFFTDSTSRRGWINVMNPERWALGWLRLREEAEAAERTPRPLSDLDMIRWTVAHELGHAVQLATQRDYRKSSAREYQAMEVGRIAHDDLPMEQEADAFANAGNVWKHVKINGRKARGTKR